MRRCFNDPAYPFVLDYPDRFCDSLGVSDGSYTYPFFAVSDNGDMIKLTYLKDRGGCLSHFENALDIVENTGLPPKVLVPLLESELQPGVIFEEPIILPTGQYCYHFTVQLEVGGVPMFECLIGRIRHGCSTLSVEFTYHYPAETRVVEWEGILRSIRLRAEWPIE